MTDLPTDQPIRPTHMGKKLILIKHFFHTAQSWFTVGRLTTEGDCRDVVRCDRAGIAGTIRLASVKCPSGLAFDLNRQTCDWKAQV